MIVKMKKVSLVTTSRAKQECLTVLRRLGVMHIETTYRENDSVTRLTAEREKISTALRLLSAVKSPENSSSSEGVPGEGKGEDAVAEILALRSRMEELKSRITSLIREIQRVTPWGDFNPEDFSAFKARGLVLSLYNLQEEDLPALTQDSDYLLLEKAKKRAKIILITRGGEPVPEGAFPLPEASLQDLSRQLADTEAELAGKENQLAAYLDRLPAIKKSLEKVEKALEFEQVSMHMEEEASLAVLSGYIPADKAAPLKKEAAAQGWGIVLQDPTDEEVVPTLIRNPRWLNIVKPVFDMLGTVPGYREFDISFWFLLFFSLFFAMIIGDAGYGAIMLLLTILARLKARKAPGAVFALLYVMCTCTIVWGAMTGTWFGSQTLARLPLLSRFTLPWIASFPNLELGIDTTDFIMNFCFILGAVHLTIAHLTNFVKKFPHLRAFADIGWLVMLWGLYFLIRNIVLQKEIYFLTGWLIGIGFGLVILFSEQNGNFFKGVGMGIAKSLLTALDAIGGFSDIISYVRLYAVGLATVEVAKAWNILAVGIGFNHVLSGLVAGLILFAGHALNIVMGAMSIVVHGVRLNMLEFSGHLGMEWAGIEYKPFKE